MNMEIITALTLEIGQRHQPVMTTYQLGCLVFRLYQDKTYHGEALKRLQRDVPDHSRYSELVRALVKNGVLKHSNDVPSKAVYTVLGQGNAEAEDIACCVDPFCYVSHMSAMAYHGFTDRLPKILFLTTLPQTQWTQLALQRMEKDIGAEIDQYREAALPVLRRLVLGKIHRKTINVYATVHCDPGAYINVQGRTLRVSTIGRTFLDMIREPDLCGGIYHVLDVYANHASRYLRQIVEVIDRHGKKIEKVRAGYILDERLGLSHPLIDAWQSQVQRGGSQKLIAKAPYSVHFSEKWCLSINIEETEES
jgi:predicted transcriptional regulator of viral defense system